MIAAAGRGARKKTPPAAWPVVPLVLPLPDAMPQGTPRRAEKFASSLGSGADAAIACPGQVAGSSRIGQEITSFARVEHRAWTPGLSPRESAGPFHRKRRRPCKTHWG